MTDEYCTIRDVARTYKVRPEMVRQRCREGVLEGAIHARRQWRIPAKYSNGGPEQDHLRIALLDLECKTSRLFETLPHVAELQIGRERVECVAQSADEVGRHFGYLRQELVRRMRLSECVLIPAFLPCAPVSIGCVYSRVLRLIILTNPLNRLLANTF
jgi:hypothetical protein